MIHLNAGPYAETARPDRRPGGSKRSLPKQHISVATYLEKREDAVTLGVQFGTLSDGTSYTATTTLDATAKNIRVVITNAGHRALAR